MAGEAHMMKSASPGGPYRCRGTSAESMPTALAALMVHIIPTRPNTSCRVMAAPAFKQIALDCGKRTLCSLAPWHVDLGADGHKKEPPRLWAQSVSEDYQCLHGLLAHSTFNTQSSSSVRPWCRSLPPLLLLDMYYSTSM